uniref:hypothetical protein n=1 Tax=Rhodopirellula sallentina TaxID=1263869 RepID=UPI001F276882|nr:hypothetical protein [Rhodopirellula sallentina]
MRASRAAIVIAACGVWFGGATASAQYPGAASHPGANSPRLLSTPVPTSQNNYRPANAGHTQHTPNNASGWNGNPGFRPVPKVRSSAMYSGNANAGAAQPSTQRPGWNLQWRTSPQVAAEQAREISDAAFAESNEQVQQNDRTHQPRIVATAADSRRSMSPQAASQSNRMTVQPNRLRQETAADVQQVAWLAQQTEAGGGGFSLPGNAFRDGSATPAPGTELVQPGPAFQVPDPSNMQELPPPSQPALPQSAPESSFGAPSGDAAPSSDLERLFDRNNEPTQPEPVQPPTQGDSSIRDMLQNEPTTPPEPVQPAPIQEEFEDSPSDRDTFAPNPFGRADEERRDDPPELEPRNDRSPAPSIFGSDDEGPTNSGTGLSCDDFRDRIRAATIDQVSLDPSPPFRPDVIDNDEFAKLKSKFSAKQEARTWRSIDGRSLGTGRLDDLAYEKAIILTEYGTREEIPLNRLSEPDLAYISHNWGLPTECLIEQVAYTPRTWTPTTMTYAASNLCHKPLYFEEVNLERYGHTAGPLAQPVISSAHFFLNIAVLPYKMGVHSPHECQYALGYYRPGNCAPWIIPPVPLSVKGAWYQAAAITGTALLVP